MAARSSGGGIRQAVPGVFRKGVDAGGFTLVELIIATSLSLMVMIAIVSLSASIVRYQFEEIRKGKATGYTLYALAQMNKELENATHLEIPSWGATGNVLGGCSNWSANMTPLPNQIDAARPIESFYYCVDSNNSLLRYSGNTCPPPVPGACGAAAAGMTINTVVYRNFYHLDDYGYFFQRRPAGPEMFYIVGYATPTANVPIPVAYKFHVRINVMNKSYRNASD